MRYLLYVIHLLQPPNSLGKHLYLSFTLFRFLLPYYQDYPIETTTKEGNPCSRSRWLGTYQPAGLGQYIRRRCSASRAVGDQQGRSKDGTRIQEQGMRSVAEEL